MIRGIQTTIKYLPGLALTMALLPLGLQATPAVQLTSSLTSPQLLGTTVAWTATATDPDPGMLVYRFSVSYGTGGRFEITKDFAQDNVYYWTPSAVEGTYVIQTTVRNNATGNTAQAMSNFTVSSRLSSPTGAPVISNSNNPIVALYSAPSLGVCQSGQFMRVIFQLGAGAGPIQATNVKRCTPPLSMNWYVAGLYPSTGYNMTYQVLDSSGTILKTGPTKAYTTGALPTNLTFPTITIPVPAGPQTDTVQNIILSSNITLGPTATVEFPIATDLNGKVLWYYPGLASSSQSGSILTRPLPQATILLQVAGPNSQNNQLAQQVLREIDLAGNTLRETNASRISEQLASVGYPGSNCTAGVGSTLCYFGAIHHDAIRLPNGDTVLFGTAEKYFNPPVQPVNNDVLGDMIAVLDTNFQVKWAWNSFDHLNVGRPAILGETCAVGIGGCPPLFLATTANDWLHSNSIQYLSADGDFLVSLRHQDWVIKIDYNNGTGTGNVLWMLGNQGSFVLTPLNPNDQFPWFSHQHDAGFEKGGQTLLDVFDDGNTRVSLNLPGETKNSRGQAYNVNEGALTATQILNADMGVYSFALGSAQLLSNGNYHFLPGFNNPGPNPFAQHIEVTPQGTIVYTQQYNAPAYRSFRMATMYTPPLT